MDRKEYQRNYRQIHKKELNEKKKWYLKHGRIKAPMTEEERASAKKGYQKKYNNSHKEQKREYNQSYQEKYRDEKNARNRVYRETHQNIIDAQNERRRKFRKENPEEAKRIDNQYKSTRLRWRNENKERLRNYNKKWYQEYPAKVRGYNWKRRELISCAPGRGITDEQWAQLIEEYNYMCVYCYMKKPEISLTLDHVEPLSKGGADDIANAVPACQSCNSEKHNKSLLRFLYDRMREEIRKETTNEC